MSTKAGCPNNSNRCVQAYPVKDYFLAMFVIVVCLVCLRMLLYASYYAWIRYSARRRRRLSSSADSRPPDNQGSPPTAENASASPPLVDPVVIVIVPGEEQPTFVATPDPLAPSKDLNTQIMSLKASDIPKS